MSGIHGEVYDLASCIRGYTYTNNFKKIKVWSPNVQLLYDITMVDCNSEYGIGENSPSRNRYQIYYCC